MMAEPEEQKLICGYSIQCLYFHRQYHSTCWVRPKRPRLPTLLQGGVSHGSHVKLHWADREKDHAKTFCIYGITSEGNKCSTPQTLCRSIFGITLKPQSRQTKNLAFTSHKLMQQNCISQGYFTYFHLNMGAAQLPVQAGVFDTCPLTQHRWFCCFADVEKWYSVVV